MEESKIWRSGDGIVVIDHGFMANVTQTVLDDVIDQLKALGGKRVPLFIKSSGQILISDEVLTYQKPEFAKYICALAIFTPSHSARSYAKRYMELLGPQKYPVKAFNKEELALAWLEQFVVEHSEI